MSVFWNSSQHKNIQICFIYVFSTHVFVHVVHFCIFSFAFQCRLLNGHVSWTGHACGNCTKPYSWGSTSRWVFLKVEATRTHPFKQKHSHSKNLDAHQQDKDPGHQVKRFCNRHIDLWDQIRVLWHTYESQRSKGSVIYIWICESKGLCNIHMDLWDQRAL